MPHTKIIKSFTTNEMRERERERPIVRNIIQYRKLHFYFHLYEHSAHLF